MSDDDPNTTRGFIAMLGFSSIFLLAGGLIIMVALKIIPVPPESVHAPLWVIGLAGATFFMGGLAIIINGLREMGLAHDRIFNFIYGLIGLSLVLGLLIPFHWVAFGSGDRQFSTTVSIPFLSVSGPGSDLGGRLAFGCFAVLADIVILSVVIRSIWRRWLAPERDD